MAGPRGLGTTKASFTALSLPAIATTVVDCGRRALRGPPTSCLHRLRVAPAALQLYGGGRSRVGAVSDSHWSNASNTSSCVR